MPNHQDSSSSSATSRKEKPPTKETSSSRKETEKSSSSSRKETETSSSSSRKEAETSSSARKEAETSSSARKEAETSSSSRKETETPNPETGVDQQTDSDLKLVEHAFYYITEKSYPPECTKNDKRSIRRKAEKLNVVNGELFYKKKDGNEVIKCCERNFIFVYMCLLCELLYLGPLRS